MENQQNKTCSISLNDLRAEIDKVDDQLISLLGSRMKIIDRVGELKKSNNEKFFIRSNREADMIKNLIKKSDSSFPKSSIISIWRKIIAAANMHEQNLKISIHNPKNIPDYSYLVREHYNEEVPIFSHDSLTNIVTEIEKGETQIGVFSLPKANQEGAKPDESSDNWWINLANNKSGIKVFAKLPFVEFSDKKTNIQDSSNLVMVAIKEAEKSSEDNSLLYVEVPKEISKSQILSSFKENKLDAKILKSVKLAQVENMMFYLVEVSGFYEESDVALKNFSKSKIKPYVKVLGCYALPIKI